MLLETVLFVAGCVIGIGLLIFMLLCVWAGIHSIIVSDKWRTAAEGRYETAIRSRGLLVIQFDDGRQFQLDGVSDIPFPKDTLVRIERNGNDKSRLKKID